MGRDDFLLKNFSKNKSGSNCCRRRRTYHFDINIRYYELYMSRYKRIK